MNPMRHVFVAGFIQNLENLENHSFLRKVWENLEKGICYNFYQSQGIVEENYVENPSIIN